MLNSSCGGKETTGSEIDSFGSELGFCFRATKTDIGHGNRLIVPADVRGGIESIGPCPAFDEPQWVGTAGSERFYRSSADRGLPKGFSVGDVRAEFPQHRIDKGGSGTFAGALDELYAFVDGSAGGNACEPAELVGREAECGKNLEIEFGEWLGRACGNL